MFVESHYCSYIIHNHRSDWKGCTSPDCPRSYLIQTDWDYPATAESFGWSLRRVQKPGHKRGNRRCLHPSTDGTVDCRECGITATEFICNAAEFLDNVAS